jgi:endoglucanase
MAYAYDITKDIQYINGVSTAMDYILGRNPLEQSYVTGYGEHATTYPHHRFWSYQLDKSFPMAPAGVLSGGPNSAMQDPWIKGMGYKVGTIAPQTCYLDNIESWSTNEVTINWNAPLAWTVSYLEDVAPTVTATENPNNPEVTTTEAPTTTASVDTTTQTDITTISGGETTTTPSTSDDGGDSTTVSTEPGDTSKIIWGDVNDDGFVDVRDVTQLKKYIVKLVGDADITAQGKLNGDVIPSGTLDVQDLGQIIKYVIKVVTDLDPAKNGY